MVSGLINIFKLRLAFSDEDARADRSPGEFYQLDIEMSFVEQEDVFEVVETLMINLFKKFSSKKIVNTKFPRIPFKEAMLKYGTDKPDLRNPLLINDITDIFTRDDVKFDIFKKLTKKGSKVRCIVLKILKINQEVFLITLINGLKNKVLQDLAYFTIEKTNKISGKGPVGKFFSEESLKELMKICKRWRYRDSLFMACGNKNEIEKILSLSRDKIARELNLINENEFAFCWILIILCLK